jgi:hypothetical protein
VRRKFLLPHEMLYRKQRIPCCVQLLYCYNIGTLFTLFKGEPLQQEPLEQFLSPYIINMYKPIGLAKDRKLILTNNNNYWKEYRSVEPVPSPVPIHGQQFSYLLLTVASLIQNHPCRWWHHT